MALLGLVIEDIELEDKRGESIRMTGYGLNKARNGYGQKTAKHGNKPQTEKSLCVLKNVNIFINK